jgi:hypothetical protein
VLGLSLFSRISIMADTWGSQGVLHVGAVVLPALIAITEIKPGMSGREFLA